MVMHDTAALYGVSEQTLYRALAARARPKALRRADRGMPRALPKMPTTPDERRFYVKLLTTLHAPFSPSEPLATLENTAMRLLRKIGLKMLVIDEAHQLLAGSYREQRRALNLLKGLTNELMSPVIAVGTEDALHAVQTDA